MGTTAKKKNIKSVPSEEANTENLLEEWDITTCKICGKEISMLSEAELINGQYFICRKGHN